MTRRIAGTALAFLVLLLATGTVQLRGQAVASAQISGLVADPSGAAVPSAKLTATQTETGLVRTTLSGPDGTYVLPGLPVGPYKLDVQASGFETYVQTGIHLEVSNNVTINITLRVGEVKQRVEVTANANMVQTQATSSAQVINQRSIIDLPLNGRQATQLIMLSGAANDIGPANGLSDLVTTKNYFSADNISVAGGQANGTNYLMDGGAHLDVFSNVNLPFPFPDALQEFSVQTSTLSARYGHSPGAVVNAITKSGTNQFHGDVFEFVRNGIFNARDFFAATQDSLKRNQFGGTIGGPIKKDKLFGFFGYQGTRIRTAPPSFISHVPTQAALNGDFSQLESASCQSSGMARTIINPATGQPFANDFVDPSLFNQQALNLLKYVPVSSDPCGELTYSIPQPQREDQYIGRADWTRSAKHNLFGRYFYGDYATLAQFSKTNILVSQQRGLYDRAQSIVLGDTYSITPSMLNSIHITYTRLAITRGTTPDMINFQDVGVNIFQAVPNYLYVGVGGHFSFAGAAPAYFRQNVNEFADDLDVIRGRHHISVGGEWIHYRLDQDNLIRGNGAFSFSGQLSNDGLVDFMLGLPSHFEQGNLQRFNGRQNYIGAYVHDNVRLTKRFNIQLGLRWEPYLPEREIFNRMDHFDQTAFAGSKKSTQFDNAPLGLFFIGDPGMPSGFTYNKLAVFAPRVGLVWDPTGSGRQTIRAGYGIFYDTQATAYSQDMTNGFPWGATISLNTPAGGLTNPFLGYPGGNPFPFPSPPSRSSVFPPEGSYYTYPLDAHPTNVQQWNLSYQVQIRNDWLFSATYLGNKTTHIWTGTDANPGVYIPGLCNGAPCSTLENTNQRRVLSLINPVAGSLYSDIWQADDGANGEYNGLLLTVQHRFSNHYTLLTNYTYSHCISESDFQGDLGGALTQNPYNRNAERGNCGFDLRHIFNASFVAETPRFANPWTNRLLGNWQLAPIVSIHSGTWFSVWTGDDNSLTGIGMDRPNAIGNPYVRNTSTRQWLTPAAFVPNALGTFGNSGSDSLVGPGFFNIDVAVSRYFNIKEKQRLELRFEFFNLTNHTNFSGPDNYLADSTFGVIQSDVSPRILQFALKYRF